LVGRIYGRSSIDIAHFVPIHLQTWLPQTILVSDWLISKKSSPLKLLSQMNQNLVGSIQRQCELLPSLGIQVLIHLAKWFQRRRFFRNKPIRNKNGLWWPCLLTDRDEMSNLYKRPSIDASYQVFLL
jgi:hypothetical protein